MSYSEWPKCRRQELALKIITIRAADPDGRVIEFKARVPLNTAAGVGYYSNGRIFHTMIKRTLKQIGCLPLCRITSVSHAIAWCALYCISGASVSLHHTSTSCPHQSLAYVEAARGFTAESTET